MPSTEFRSMVRFWLLRFSGKFPAQQVFLPLVVGGQEEAALRVLIQFLSHFRDKLFRRAFSHGDGVVRAPDMDAHAGGARNPS